MSYTKKLSDGLIDKILAKGVRDMPQNPAAQGYSERQIRGFYYLTEEAILELINIIEDEIIIALKEKANSSEVIENSDIIDNLSCEEEGKALSARQGKVLNEEIKTIHNKIIDSFEIESNENNYTYKFNFKDKNGKVLFNKEIDLPIESTVIHLDFNNESKTLIFTLRNKEKFEVPLDSIIQGLASSLDFEKERKERQEADKEIKNIIDNLPLAQGEGARSVVQKQGGTTGSSGSPDAESTAKGTNAVSLGSENIIDGDNGFGAGRKNKQYQNHGTVVGAGNTVGSKARQNAFKKFYAYAANHWDFIGRPNYGFDNDSQKINAYLEEDFDTVFGYFLMEERDTLTNEEYTALTGAANAGGWSALKGYQNSMGFSAGMNNQELGACGATFGNRNTIPEDILGAFIAGWNMKASRDYQALFGQYGKVVPDALLVVGNGQTDENDKSNRNALELLVDGRLRTYPNKSWLDDNHGTEDFDVLNRREINNLIKNELGETNTVLETILGV